MTLARSLRELLAVEIGDHNVTVGGRVVDGLVKLGTAFIP